METAYGDVNCLQYPFSFAPWGSASLVNDREYNNHLPPLWVLQEDNELYHLGHIFLKKENVILRFLENLNADWARQPASPEQYHPT